MREDVWYHLSATKWTRGHIGSLPQPDPSRSFEENRPPGTSVSPTICQCLIAVPEDRANVSRLFNYEVDVHEPAPIPDDANVWDRETTEEHIITEEVLAANGGRIEVRYVGWVRFTGETLFAIKGALNQLKVRFSAQREMDFLWKIEGEEWVARFNGPGWLKRLISP